MNGRTVYRGRDVRQGRIVLDRPVRRTIFIAGLAGIVLVGLVLVWAA